MTVGDFLNHATRTLTQADIASARLDCLILLEDVLHVDRSNLIAHPEVKIPPKTEVTLNTKVAQRAKHIPLAYLRGKAYFYGREFVVNKNVLIPRPETEVMITILKHLPLLPNPTIADIGTGSGCLGLTAALEIKNDKVHLFDINASALTVARQNAHMLGVKVTLHQNDLLEQQDEPFDVILANLPYVPDEYRVNDDARHEPKLALFAGKDGLDLYRRFWQQIKTLKHKPSFILTESLAEQHQSMNKLAIVAGYQLIGSSGLAQSFSPS